MPVRAPQSSEPLGATHSVACPFSPSSAVWSAEFVSRCVPPGPEGDDGLVLEDHSGGFRIKPLRPLSADDGYRILEVRPPFVAADSEF
jgi:hypothetical protein